ncbi:sensor histidine kinase [Vallitalea maricola]|uniref:HAMP domain-containing sensor histidine kinase n=1 Tax=Vallitalea maricola TaxID=3074433 RepID=A0ACB5URR8_9FIRM|nr:HAMP domain-containing sensor histidine kinase [Vallitalea sp. AN17-2]
MTKVKLSINSFFHLICSLMALLSAVMICVLYFITDDFNVIWVGLLFSVIVFSCLFSIILFVRRKLVMFSDVLCGQLDSMMAGEIEPPQLENEESIFYKINHRLTRLYEVMRESRLSIAKERAALQELISDISHQVKTPIANLKIVNATLLEQTMSKEKQKDFLTASAGQLDKLDFLMQAMIKTSRLETGVITLEQKMQPIYETLASALGGILLNAEQKNISVKVACNEDLLVFHDRKWTSEALFNILDNAVKYTTSGGSIRVSVEAWEMHLKIDISNTGKGIPEKYHSQIFKRFYREEEVHDTPGIGIGLYLAREIITMQGGYIKVVSEVGKGATFSVFLSHK